MAPLAAIDCETTGLNVRTGDQAFSVAVCYPDPAIKNFHKWPTEFFCWPVNPYTRKVEVNPKHIARLRKIVNSHRMIFHNGKFDVHALRACGLKYYWGPDLAAGKVASDHYEDTLLASHVMDSGESHKLKDLAERYFDISTKDEDHLQKITIKLRKIAKNLGWNIAEDVKADYWLGPTLLHEEYMGTITLSSHENDLATEGTQAVEIYNCLDVIRTAALWMMYNEILREEGLYPQYRREKRLQPILYRTERRGITVLKAHLEREVRRYQKEVNECAATCQRIAFNTGYSQAREEELNLQSPTQLTEFLFGDPDDIPGALGIEPAGETKTGNPSTDVNAIKFLLQREDLPEEGREFLDNFRSFKLNNTASHYLKSYRTLLVPDETPAHNFTPWRMFPNFNQTGTATTRLSSNNPNGQNISKGKETDEGDIDFSLRSVFGPAKHRVWYDFDYDQLQLRIFAVCAGETSLIEGFRNGYDAHDMVTAQIFDMTVDELHSLPPAEYKLKRRIGKNTNFGFIFGAGERKIELTAGMPGLSKILAQRFPHATEYMAIVSEQVRQRGFVQTLGGYRLSVPKSKPYSGVCYIVQGTEGEIVKDAMIEVAKYLFLTHAEEAYITLQVHDSIIVDFPLTKTRPCKPDTRKRLDDLRYIAGIMERAGRRVGVETPAACEKVAYNWGEPVKLDLGSIPRVAFGRKRKRVTL